MITTLYEGLPVVLWTPENERLHLTPATVKRVTDWGAFLNCPAAATGEYRATPDEMIPAEAHDDAPKGPPDPATVETPVDLWYPSDTPPSTGSNGHGKPYKSKVILAREEGYCGDPCDICGSFKVRRKGVCLSCDDCGASGGCG